MSVPGVHGYIETNAHPTEPKFIISGTVIQKDRTKVDDIISKVHAIIRSNSIYKGKAVRIDMSYTRDGEGFNMTEDVPEFIDIRNIKENELILPRHIEQLLKVALFAPIEHTEVCRQRKIPLKRGVLLSGEYGVGKTLTAYITALKAVKNGWTMLYLKNVEDLASAIELARLYAPAVVFAEDIDHVVPLDRNEEANEILNTIDGIDGKSNEIIVVLTTNHIENIHAALLRPGRLDAVVQIPTPDAEAVERLVRLYARDTLSKNIDLAPIGNMLAGAIPALIREVVERSKMWSIVEGDGKQITAEALETSARAMQEHLKLLSHRSDDKRYEIIDHFAKSFASGMAQQFMELAIAAKKAAQPYLERIPVAEGVQGGDGD
jgi:transitional endoplasmic reticulum ATPase